MKEEKELSKSSRLRRRRFGTVTLVGGYLFVFGGVDGLNSRTSTTIAYNLAKDTWEVIHGKGLPVRSMHSAVLADDALLFYGGYGHHATQDSLLRFDLLLHESFKLTTYGEAPGPRRAHCSAYFPHLNAMLMFGGSTYGGRTNASVRSNDVYSFAVSTSTWHKLAPRGQLPSAKSRMCEAVVNRQWFIYGGINPGRRVNDLFILDLAPIVPVWSRVDLETSIPVSVNACLVHMDSKLVLVHKSSWVFERQVGTKWSAKELKSMTNYSIEGVPPGFSAGCLSVRVQNSIVVLGGQGEMMFEPMFLTWERA